MRIAAVLQSIYRDLNQLEGDMIKGQKVHIDYVKVHEKSWLSRLNFFAIPVSIYEDDIALIDSLIPDLTETETQILGLKKSIVNARRKLHALEGVTWVDKTVDLLGTFQRHQVTAQNSLQALVEVLNFEDASNKKAATVTTVTVIAAPSPTD
ncbi:hypothetical protein PG987_008146 [Apiospora arundinis]